MRLRVVNTYHYNIIKRVYLVLCMRLRVVNIITINTIKRVYLVLCMRLRVVNYHYKYYEESVSSFVHEIEGS